MGTDSPDCYSLAKVGCSHSSPALFQTLITSLKFPGPQQSRRSRKHTSTRRKSTILISTPTTKARRKCSLKFRKPTAALKLTSTQTLKISAIDPSVNTNLMMRSHPTSNHVGVRQLRVKSRKTMKKHIRNSRRNSERRKITSIWAKTPKTTKRRDGYAAIVTSTWGPKQKCRWASRTTIAMASRTSSTIT